MLIIEVDGPQHFRQIHNWALPSYTRESDVFKMNLALQHGYRIIRISQTDVSKDPDLWKTRLKKAIDDEDADIQMLASDEKLYDEHWNGLRLLQMLKAPLQEIDALVEELKVVEDCIFD